MNWKLIGYCKHCGSPVYYSEDENKVKFTGYDCDCEVER